MGVLKVHEEESNKNKGARLCSVAQARSL